MSEDVETKRVGRPRVGRLPLSNYERDLRRRAKQSALHLEMRSFIVRNLHDRRAGGEDVRPIIDGLSTPLRAELAQAACSVARMLAMDGKPLGSWVGLVVALLGDKPLPEFILALPPADDAMEVRHGFVLDGQEIPF